MKKERIPLYDLKMDATTLRLVRETLKSGWLTTGPRVRQFEKEISRYMDRNHVAAVSSATHGILVSLQGTGIGPGHEVITSPFTFVATVEAIVQAGATPVFADIDPATLNIDPDEVARKISRRTSCIMPIDIAGCPADYDRLVPLAESSNVALMSDSSHALGARYRGKSIPSHADVAVFSFHSTKNLTCGEGGLVVSKFKPFIERVRLNSLHSLSATGYQRRKKKEFGYDVSELGFKANMSDVHAAVGLGQLRSFDRNQVRRGKIADRYIRNLSALSEYLSLPSIHPEAGHAWHLFIIRLHLSGLTIDRDQFIRLMSRRGIECGVHYKPIFDLTLFRQAGISRQHYPNSAYAGKRVISLPMYPSLRLSQVDRVCEQIVSIVKRHRR